MDAVLIKQMKQSNKSIHSDSLVNTGLSDSMGDMLCKLLHQQAAPNVNVQTIDGNRLNFQYFMSVFKEVVESKIDD